MVSILNTAIAWIQSRISGERGQDLIEYALLSGVIAVAFTGLAVGLYTGAVQDMADGISRCVDFNASTLCG